MFKDGRSVTLDKLRRGDVVFSFKSNLTCPHPVEIAAMCGFDCIWVCSEHGSVDASAMESQILAALGAGADIVVRVPRGSYSDLVRPLELNASGIMVPHVMSGADARKIAYNVRFHPVGRRAVDGGNRDGKFCLMPFHEYISFMNENRFVIVQVEDVEAMSELDEICSTDGIDIIFFGPADYSQSIGRPGNIFDSEVVAARRKVAETAIKHGKFAGTVGNLTNCRELIDEGFRFINLGSDVVALGQYCTKTMTEAAAILNKEIKQNKVEGYLK